MFGIGDEIMKYFWKCILVIAMVMVCPGVQASPGILEKIPDGASFSRIACLVQYPAEILCDMGEADRIVAICKRDKNDVYYEQLKDKPMAGGGYGRNINIEMVIATRPDLVFCTSGQENALKNRGFAIYVTGTYDIDGIMGLITDVGKAAGRGDKAELIIDRMKDRIRRVEEIVKAARVKPKVYFEQSELGKTRAGGSLTHDLITRAGGINIAKDEPVPFPILSQEFIIKQNPDVIIVEKWGTRPETVLARDGWQHINAVSEKRMLLSLNYYTGYTARCLDGLEAYAAFFYPELFHK